MIVARLSTMFPQARLSVRTSSRTLPSSSRPSSSAASRGKGETEETGVLEKVNLSGSCYLALNQVGNQRRFRAFGER